mmetsp:Transcript_137665/g.343600  ORF Transcript_137665/g.343600 Transcript_137665/m.343600 type:complete len:207 (-) Transcript_137665:136-756(-)
MADLPRCRSVIQTLWGGISCDARTVFEDATVKVLPASRTPSEFGAQLRALRDDMLCLLPSHWYLVVGEVRAPACDRKPEIGFVICPAAVTLLLRANESTKFLHEAQGILVASDAPVEGDKRAEINQRHNVAFWRNNAGCVLYAEPHPRQGINAVLSFLALSGADDVLCNYFSMHILGHACQVGKVKVLNRPLVDAYRRHCSIEIKL